MSHIMNWCVVLILTLNIFKNSHIYVLPVFIAILLKKKLKYGNDSASITNLSFGQCNYQSF